MNRLLHKLSIDQRSLWVSVFTVFLLNTGFAQQASLYWLGTLGGNSSYARAVSENGTVVGIAKTSNYLEHAFIWTAAEGMQDLGTLGGDASEAMDISADGSVVVGWAYDSNSIKRAFRWTSTDGMQDLNAGDYSIATAVSADGSVIAMNVEGIPYSWTASGGMKILESLGTNWSDVTDVSADGSLFTGTSRDSSGNPYAVRWNSNGGVEKVGTFYSFARGISGDGLTITGFETGSAGLYRAFRWTQSAGFEFSIAGNFSAGNAVSGNGNIIVGYFGDGAFRSINAGAPENLNQVFSSLISAGSDLSEASDISPDGNFIAGNGVNGTSGRDEGFLVDTSSMTLVKHPGKSPVNYDLSQNYPNPFNPNTIIEYSIQQAGRVSLTIYNSLGERIKTLVNQEMPAGRHSVHYNAHGLASGIYFYKLQTEGFTSTRKMLLLE